MEPEAKNRSTEASASGPLFFSVSTTKFILMMLSTFSIYQIYWFWKNWVAVKSYEKSEIMPFWRSVFSVLFALPLFRKISTAVKQNGHRPSTEADAIAWVYILLAISTNVTSRLNGYIADIGFFAYWIIFVPFLEIQRQINFSNVQIEPTYAPESKFSVLEKFIIVLGGSWFIISCVALGLELFDML